MAQDSVVEVLSGLFPGAAIVDRRQVPSHGYRAVHVIARHEGVPIEIQVRSSLQHRWAELSEKLSDLVEASVKYGGGPQGIRELLTAASQMVAKAENLERRVRHIEQENGALQQTLEGVQSVQDRLELSHSLDESNRTLKELSAIATDQREQIATLLESIIDDLPTRREAKP